MKARLGCGIVFVALVAAASAWAATNGDGDLLISFDASLHPTTLPRHKPAPVTVTVSGDVRSASGADDELPQLRKITVAINRAGKLFDRGLPSCRPRNVQPATERGALAECAEALVGSGHVKLQVRIPGQIPFLVRANLLAFNGPRHGRRKLIVAQVYARDPPGSFILPFRVRKRSGVFGTVLSTALPPRTRPWAYLLHFEMTLHRLYRYHGRERSYVSAACAAPGGLPGAVFPFARATYAFADGRRFTLSESGACHVGH